MLLGKPYLTVPATHAIFQEDFFLFFSLALSPERPRFPDRAYGRVDPPLLPGPAAVPPRPVGGVTGPQHAEVLHSQHAGIHGAGDTFIKFIL